MMHKTLSLFTALLLAVITIHAQFEPGCTDENASNYDASATIDDGTCCYENWVTVEMGDPADYVLLSSTFTSQFIFGGNGTTQSFCASSTCYTLYYLAGVEDSPLNVYVNGELILATNYTEVMLNAGYLNIGIGEISGCANMYACNYNPQANCDDGSCVYDCLGCTDPSAPNYSETATIDDGSCCTDDHWITASFPGYTGSFASGYIAANFGSYFELYEGSTFCLPDGCYLIQLFLDGGNSDVNFQLTKSLGEVIYESIITENFFETNFEFNAVGGCSDPAACNFNPNATCFDYASCTYDCFGCTNPEAGNYDPNASVDDGSCCLNTLTFVSSAFFTYNVWSNYNQGANGWFPDQASFCVEDGCFSVDVYGEVFEAFDWQLLDEEGNVVYSGTAENGFGTTTINLNAVVGCMVADACNFDPNATCSDYNLCDFSCQGCTDPNAPNYDADATIDDGTCCNQGWFTLEFSEPGNWYVYSNYGGGGGSGHYPEVSGFCVGEGCFTLVYYPDNIIDFDISGSIYDEQGNVITSAEFDPNFGGINILVDNGSIAGCMDQSACNFDPLANCYDFGACDYGCYGCADPSAPNYNPDATIDNGTCCYSGWYNVELSSPGNWYVYSYADGGYQAGYYPDQTGFCMSDDCIIFGVWSDDSESGTYSITNEDGEVYASGTYDYFGYSLALGGEDDILGCGDFSACNYDPLATCSDYATCDYSCYGCTDPSAPNYNESATIDNGTCCTSNWYTINISGPSYWYVYGLNTYGGGFSPENTGFCGGDDCFHVGIYPMTNEPLSVTILDSEGNILATTIIENMNFGSVSVSTNGEIAGCTDPNSCNYNPDATCDDWSCSIYCGGCLDDTALNYNPNAQYDDGSCVYFVDPPLMGMIIMPDEMNNQYYVMVNMLETGNGSPYVVSDDFGSSMMMIDEEGQYLAGPYPCDESVVIQLESMSIGMQEYFVSSPLNGPCSETVGVNEELELSTLQVFPNPANEMFSVTGISGNICGVTVYDMNGRQVMNRQMNVSSGRIDVNCDEFTSGLYQVRISDLSGDSILRVIVE